MIGKYLDVSTAHVKRETMQDITDTGRSRYEITNRKWLPVIAVYPEGAFLWVSEEPETDNPNLPEELKRLLKIARAQDCYLIRLDADGDIIPGLLTYDW